MENSEPKVSVIIPVHNRAGLLRSAVESVISQTYGNVECVIVDDASSDGSFEAASELARTHRSVSAFRSEKNLGPGGARNLGFGKSSGEFVTFLDSDDSYLPEHVALRVGAMLGNGWADYLYGTMRVNGDGFVVDKDDPSRKIPISETSMGATAFVRRSVFKYLRGYDETKRYGEDWDLLERAKKAGLCVVKVPWETYVYNRGLPDSLTTLAESRMP